MPEQNTDKSNISAAAPTVIYDVVVVGAGPIGLATAIGLRQRGIENILVIDQTRAFRPIGQVLDILPNGLKSLKYLAFTAYENVKKTGFGFFNSQQPKDEKLVEEKPPKTSPAWVTKNLHGQTIRSISLEYDRWFQDYGEGRMGMPWYSLQTTLRDLLPQDCVKANHRCINVVDEPEYRCVRIDCESDANLEANPYAYWSEETQPQNSDSIPQQSAKTSIHAKLIVAADGINSTVRRVLYADSPYRDFARPQYSGFAAINCREITDIPKELATEIADKFFQDSRILTIRNQETSANSGCMEDPSMILFCGPNGQLGYVMHLALPLDSLQGKTGSALIDLAMTELEKAGFPDSLKQLVSLSPPGNMQQRPYYIHPATLADTLRFPSTANPNSESDSAKIQPAWSMGRVVLVGDAAHGMPPFMAQGANQGLEDALAIVTLIANIAENDQWDNQEAIATAFENYEHIRRPMMAYIQQATLTRFAQSSAEEWQEYNQKVYGRNFEEALGLLECRCLASGVLSAQVHREINE